MKLARLMHSPRGIGASLFAVVVVLAPAMHAAADGVVFQRPNRGKPSSTSTAGAVQFRAASSTAAPASTPAPVAAAPTAAPAPVTSANPLRTATATRVVATGAARPIAATAQAAAKPISQAPRPVTATPSFAQPGQTLSGTGANPQRARAIADASIQPWIEESDADPSVRQASFGGGYCDCGEPTCGICEPACGCAEPGCGICEAACGVAEPGCGLMEPTCGCGEPTCGICEPGCGIAEPDCGMVGCGSCVGNPGPDYWCFPVCLPRFKDLRVWSGVHGFTGPIDDVFDDGEGNFGFQEGINIGGRAPLISLLFPQLAYQLGFQAVQSHLSGLADGTVNDRSQEFVTAGLFRRVQSGVQFGVAYDWMQDDFRADADYSQLRYEISLKGRSGLEFGFWGASHLSDSSPFGDTIQTVDQYNAFLRWQFREGGSARVWGGGTNDSEGIFGAEFIAPLNNRWSVNSGFNYLITDQPAGQLGSLEETWNIGINLVWHYGLIAKKGNSNPFAPLFSPADNGTMALDFAP